MEDFAVTRPLVPVASRFVSGQDFRFPSFPRRRESSNPLKKLDTRIRGYDKFKGLAKVLPVFVHRPAVSDWASSRPRLATTPLPFSLPSALRKPGHRTSTYEVTRHARRTRLKSSALRRLFGGASVLTAGLGVISISVE
jgi:hypothetical protein